LHKCLVVFGQFKLNHLITLSSRLIKMTGHLTGAHKKAQKAQNHLAGQLCIFFLFVAILRACRRKIEPVT
jgi:hypothetical protein